MYPETVKSTITIEFQKEGYFLSCIYILVTFSPQLMEIIPLKLSTSLQAILFGYVVFYIPE